MTIIQESADQVYFKPTPAHKMYLDLTKSLQSVNE